MKVAIMLTGLARKVQEGYNGYWKHIIENYDVDLYLHAWESKSDGITNHEDSNSVLEVYSNPKYFLIESPFKFTKYREGIDNPNNDKSRPLEEFDVYGNFRSFPMYYGWESTYKHIINSNIQYDCVIRSRYDLEGPNLVLEKLDLHKINTSNYHWRGSNIHDDNLCISNLENSNNIFTNIFTDIINYHKSIGYINGAEQNFTNFLVRNNLIDKAIKSDEINFKLLRDNKLWF